MRPSLGSPRRDETSEATDQTQFPVSTTPHLSALRSGGRVVVSPASMAAVVRGVLKGIKEKGLANFLRNAREEGYL